jgi:arsenite methyltransferase
VYERYRAAASRPQAELCCPVSYRSELLAAIPEEILQRDYGCGDPTPYVRPGDTVLDLGSGAGKLCYIMAQMVGPQGRVIGVDFNAEMLALARRHQPMVAQRLGYDNVEFRRGMIQDLQLDLEALAAELAAAPVRDAESWLQLQSRVDRLRREAPLVASESVDCIVSNCVLNLVRREDRQQMFREMLRVLRRGGRVALSDIVSDEDVPEHLQRDPQLWSGCISGAFREGELVDALEEAGFYGIYLAHRNRQPWRVVEGIEFRSVTIVAYKGKEGPCLDRNQALIYRGPFKMVIDDDDHVFCRGQRAAVCDKTYHLLQREPYAGQFEPVPPREEVPLESAPPFECTASTVRHARETKGRDFCLDSDIADRCCGQDECC